jgi:glutamine amidotransferase
MRITIFDFGAGNLHSLAKAIGGDDVRLETSAKRAIQTDLLVLPGVGAFGAAVERIGRDRDVMASAIRGGLPTIGVCLGMQLLFEASDEGAGTGLGVIAGRVARLSASRLPQIGWNTIEQGRDAALTRAPVETVYYANGYVCRPTNPAVVTAWSTHEGDRFPAMVRSGATVGLQFHPEKSSAAGVRFLRTLVDEARR